MASKYGKYSEIPAGKYAGKVRGGLGGRSNINGGWYSRQNPKQAISRLFCGKCGKPFKPWRTQCPHCGGSE